MTPYVGRFAPTPSGDLHFGSLLGALGSYLQAKTQNGTWRLRIDDLDEPRVVPGSIDSIQKALEALGLFWDGPVLFQSQRSEAYQAVWERLKQAGLVYPCFCSRKEIAQQARMGAEGPIYPGTCREAPSGPTLRSWRLRTQEAVVELEDLNLGPQRLDLEREVGDFVLWRGDGIAAYHLATVVDEGLDRITELVRGSDLLPSTMRHLYLMDLLKQPRPSCLHLPLATNRAGEKLSKQTQAPPLQPEQASADLFAALEFLGQHPPGQLKGAPPAELLAWAIAHWSLPGLNAATQGR